MPSCAIYGCKSGNKNGKANVKFFRFPKSPDIAEKWINACKRKDKFVIQNARICSLHFTDDAFEKPLIQTMLEYSPKSCRKIKKSAIPTQNIPGCSNITDLKQMKNKCRDQRKERRDNHEMAYALLSLSESHNGNGNFKINDTDNHEMSYALLSLSESHNGNGNFKINGSKETESSETDNKSPNCEDVEENDPVNHSIDVESNRLSDELCGKTDISILEYKIKDLQTEGDHYKNLCEELSKKVNNLEKQNIYYKNLIVVQSEEIAKFKSALENNSQDKIDSAIREGIENILSKLFTEGQIKLLLSEKKRVKEWSGNDIASAISLRSVRPKAFLLSGLPLYYFCALIFFILFRNLLYNIFFYNNEDFTGMIKS